MLKGTILETEYYRLLERYLVPILVKLKLRPNHVSLIGLALSLAAGVAFAFRPFWGGVFTLLSGLVDTLDGSLARSTGQVKKYGAFLDSVLDRYAELVIYLGIYFYFYRQGSLGHGLTLVLLLILFGSLMVSYTRARAEGLGQKCLVGLLQRGERVILLGIGGMANPFFNRLMELPFSRSAPDAVLMVVLVILAVGTNLTALWRFWHVLNNLKQEGSSY
ncbi:CDP-diacylglycerol--glycerol-3-phosphate 3-phosphatidyltransferase [Desulfacinum hydrothermale DSM 13146]|uniref:CDP-diacylglycerol--glycerol-3-phosphate 3-phosphatidyltransferase n=1 Tax=Desulfacinum hydrothermale DSM 13146 TaxID=1121390 RepID=A0A1W1XLX0_9BACT|nr:CDP-alcohol phosphatidyltransferase family protein [Desulfacinum hydrothermale]SMC24827.1 CDP-diacylglycerol--glycerol-3-phosphate 3-phosphatidyltransferase [Desulfacinum hydrothermale DSM 13146]